MGTRITRLLIGCTSGRTLERFFEEVGKPVDDDGGALVFENQPAVERIVEVAATYGIEIPPPMAE